MQFRLFGLPVRVEISFLIVAALLAVRRQDSNTILIWVAVVIVSVLAHELGHAWVARWLGLQPRIQLYAMGGVTSWSGPRLAAQPQILVSLAGPLTGFLVGLAVLALMPADSPRPFYLSVLRHDLLWVNFGWGIINLLPMLPLDGGQVMRSVLQLVRRTSDERGARLVSVACAAVLALLALSRGFTLGALWAGYFGWINYSELQRLPRSPGRWG